MMKRVVNSIIKYKLLHIAFWLWEIISLIHLREERFGGSILSQLPSIANIIFPQMAVIYAIIYILVPHYLQKQRYALFAVCSIGFIAIGSIVSSGIVFIYHFLTYHEKLSGFLITVISQFIDMTLMAGIFLSIVVVYTMYRRDQYNRQLEKEKLQLEKEKLETELNFLKAQINPHFLFNALNSIYVLIKHNRELAGDTLLKFSGMLRYQLYECSNLQVEIERELLFLDDYIGLEQVRNRDNVSVINSIPAKVEHFKIAPFLLLPFVENAFKHVSKYPKRENYIRIDTVVKDQQLFFSVINTFDKNANERDGKEGIGLQNVLRRLELLYPAAHKLDIEQENGIYKVNLTLYANENELHHS